MPIPAFAAARSTRRAPRSSSKRLVIVQTAQQEVRSDLDALLKGRGVGEPLLDLRYDGAEDGLRIVGPVGKIGDRHPKQPVESRGLKMNGEYVEVALQDEFCATKRAGSHDDGTWGELLRNGFADADEITLVQIKLDEQFGACRDRVDHRAPSQVSLTLFEITNVMPKRRNGNGSVQLHRSTRVCRMRTPTADEADRLPRFYPALRDSATCLQGPNSDAPDHQDPNR
jgi:hypothetical protein